jgi:hypothetical protein
VRQHIFLLCAPRYALARWRYVLVALRLFYATALCQKCWFMWHRLALQLSHACTAPTKTHARGLIRLPHESVEAI